MSHNPEETIDSVERFVETILRDVAVWKTTEDYTGFPWMPWFRGEPLTATPLLPKLYRQPASYSETALLHHFRRMAAVPDYSRAPVQKATDEWLFLARHHGLPTRLLDWSEGALVALYFALREPLPSVVWMLQPLALNAESGLDGFDLPWIPWHPSAANIRAAWQNSVDKAMSPFPIGVYPTHVHPRLRVQKSCFTVHGGIKNGIDEIMRDAGVGRYLKMYTLSQPHRNQMLAALEVLGISHSTLFPDLDGLAEELGSRFNRTSPELSGRS